MPTHLRLGRDIDGNLSGEFSPADYIDNYVLAATVAQTVTVPAGVTAVAFSATDDFYVRWSTGTAAIPGVNVTDGSGAEINPVMRSVYPGQTFSVIAPRACVVACAFYG